MAQGYKSDASHCANPDIAGEDVPTSIKNLVSDILKVSSFELLTTGMPKLFTRMVMERERTPMHLLSRLRDIDNWFQKAEMLQARVLVYRCIQQKMKPSKQAL